MKKFLVKVSCEKYVTYEVEANNEMEAIDIAEYMDERKCVDHEEMNYEYEVKLIEDGIDEEAYRQQFIENLEGLVNHRYSYEDLAGLIRSWTQLPDLEIHMDIGDDDCTDYHAIFDIEGDNADHPLAGEFDIYYLKLREEACEAMGHPERIHITEVNYEF